MPAPSKSSSSFPLPFPGQVDGRAGELVARLREAYTYADVGRLHQHADSIARVAILISSKEISDLLQRDEAKEFKQALVDYIDWIVSNVELLCYAPNLHFSEDGSLVERNVRISLEDAIFNLRCIIERLGGRRGGRLHRQILRTAKLFHKQVRGIVRLCCGNFRKLGLSESRLCHHFFIRYLVPEPRGDCLYGDA